MAASEQQRLMLRNHLVEILGEEEAEVLMDSLPPVHWRDLATKDDIRASEDRLRTEMNGKFAQVEGEFAMLRAENKEFRGEMALQFAKQTRTMVFTMLAFAVPTWGSILAVGLT